MMEEQLSRLSAVLDQLPRFGRGHLCSDRGEAAAAMLTVVADAWPEISTVDLGPVPVDGRDAEDLALGIIRDVGEMARILGSATDPERELAWARANLIGDLECYLAVIGRPCRNRRRPDRAGEPGVHDQGDGAGS